MSALATSLRQIGARTDAVDRRLIALLAALLLVFGLLLGDRLFNPTSIRSMAFQLPELGILSLAMMVALLSGGLDLSIIATANLVALTMAYIITTMVSVDPGVLWGVWQIVALLARACRGAGRRGFERVCHRLPRRLAYPGNAGLDDADQRHCDWPDARRHLV